VTPPPRLHALGDHALTVTFADRITPDAHARVRALLRALQQAPPEGVVECVPAYSTLSVWFDPARTRFETLAPIVERLAHRAGSQAPPAGREWVIPVRYDGPDLAAVARDTGLPPDEVVARHAGGRYTVLLLGFVPGFAYLGGLDPALALPRRASPRRRVPAGSVAIAGEQTAVYPLDTPGGWHLIGSTGLRLFDPGRDPPALLRVGDHVRFEPCA
jgi:KipI family sensor histidine kinase inhibitor